MLIVLGLLLSNAFLVSGRGDRDEDSSGHEADEERRKLRIEESDRKVVVKSETELGKLRSRIDFELKTEDGEFEMRVNYFDKTEDSKSRFQARVEVQQVVEFRDVDAIKGYSSGDTVVSSINFDRDGKNNSFWKPIVCTTGANRYDCTVETTDGQFSSAVHLVGNVTDVQGIPVRPTSVKFDININLAAKQADTYVAVIIKSRSKEIQVEHEKSDENEEGFTERKEKQVSFGDNGFFSWVTTATVAGEAGIEVYNAPLEVDNQDQSKDTAHEEGEKGHRLAFTFQSTKVGLIEWDPKLAANSFSGASRVGVSIFLLAVLAVIAQSF